MTKLLLALALLLTGCTAPAVVPTPAPVASFDLNAFTALATAQATIEAAKLQAMSVPSLKGVVSQAIAAYNATEAAWQLYHAGGVGAPSQAEMQAQLDFLKGALGLLGVK